MNRITKVRYTLIEHLEGKQYVVIHAMEPWSRTLLKNLSRKIEPNEPNYDPNFRIIEENDNDDSIYANVPLSWVHISPPRKLKYDRERRKKRREQIEAIKSGKNKDPAQEA